MRFTQEISIFNPFAIEKQVMALGTSIRQTADEIELRAAETYATKGQMYDVESKISQTAHTISLSVTGTADKTTGASLTISLLDENGNVISEGAGTIKLNGSVVFANDLSGTGTTTVNGSRIHGGTLRLGGASNGNGQLYVYDASNNEIGHWNNTGIYIKNGEIYQEQYVNSTFKNAWLRIQSTDVTGGYTGLGHVAKLDMADYVDYVTPDSTRRLGVLSLQCQNGGVVIKPDDVFVVNTPKDIQMLANKVIHLKSASGSTYSTTQSELELNETDARLYANVSGQSRSHVYLGANAAELYRRDSNGNLTTAVSARDDEISMRAMMSDGSTVASALFLFPDRHAFLYANDFYVRRPDYDSGYYATTTAYNTAFAPRGDGVPRHCDIINGLICNLRADY